MLGTGQVTADNWPGTRVQTTPTQHTPEEEVRRRPGHSSIFREAFIKKNPLRFWGPVRGVTPPPFIKVKITLSKNTF